MAATDRRIGSERVEATDELEASESNFQIFDSPVIETEMVTDQIEAPSYHSDGELFEDQDLHFENYESEEKSDLNFFPGAQNYSRVVRKDPPPESQQPASSFHAANSIRSFPNARKSTGATSPVLRSRAPAPLPPPLQELPLLQPIRTEFPQRAIHRSPSSKSPFILANGNPLRRNPAQANSPRQVPPPPPGSPASPLARRKRSSNFGPPLSKTTFSPKPAFKTIRQSPFKPIHKRKRSEELEPTLEIFESSDPIDFPLEIAGSTSQIVIPEKAIKKDDDDCVMTFEGSNWRKTTSTEAMKNALEVSEQAGKRKKRRKFQNPQSKFTGVSWCNQHERWAVVVQGKVDGKKMNRNIGIFPCKSEVRCARLYDLAALKSGRTVANFQTEAAFKKALENHKRDDLTKEQMEQNVALVQTWGKKLFSAKDLRTLFPGVKVRFT